jgi:hypothetical protein
MAENLYDEAIVDVVGPNAMLSAPYTIKVSIYYFVTVLILTSHRIYFSVK